MSQALAVGVIGIVARIALADTVSEPLFVTDYLPDRFKIAQKESAVELSDLGWEGTNAMHSGFMTLDKKLGRNTFFWYFSSLDGNASAPLLLWLQGGPGASSLFGMFIEIGPFGIGPGGIVKPRGINWNLHYHLLFLDNPVGTGFSFTDTEAGYISSHEQAGADLQNAMSQFFQLFPELRPNEFYVTGESYAGKWVPSCAYTVHKHNQALPAAERINLKGIAIGDGALHPGKQFQGFGDLLWYLGMADESERARFRSYEAKMGKLQSQGDNVGAFEVWQWSRRIQGLQSAQALTMTAVVLVVLSHKT